MTALDLLFPLDSQKVAADTTPRDYLQALRLLNFPTVAPGHWNWLETFVIRIRDVPELEGDYHLFHGKLLMRRRQFQAAAEEFDELTKRGVDEVSAFDGQTRLREAGYVYKAIVQHYAGNTAAARRRLEEVLQTPGITPSSQQWAREVLAGMPR